MIKPVFTEKSLKQAREGKYTFLVEMSMEKPRVKAEIGRAFGVHVTGVKTVVGKSESRRNTKGQKFSTRGVKKAIVTVKSGEKIDIFEETKK